MAKLQGGGRNQGRRPPRCIHWAGGRVWECRRCKSLDKGRQLLGKGRCTHNRRAADCRPCARGPGRSASCEHGKLARRCTLGCSTGAAICACGKRATECARCAPAHRLCPHRRRWRACKEPGCSRRGIMQGNIVRLEYIEANLRTKDAEFKPWASRCRWSFPSRGAPTLLLCSMSDYPELGRDRGMYYPLYPNTHWAFGIVLYEQPRVVHNTKRDLVHEWRRWADQTARAATIKGLASKYPSGLAYRIRQRVMFDAPVPVRALVRNYGDGWIKAEHLELRHAINLPAWTRASLALRETLAQDRPQS